MRRKAIQIIFSIFGLLILPFTLRPVPPVFSHTAAVTVGGKVLVDAGDTAALARLQANGGQRLVDYGAFSLWRQPARAQFSLQSQSGLTPVDDSILLRDITLTPGQAAVDILAPQAQGAGIWMVQFIGPPQPAWLDALRAGGLEIISYLPNNGYLVWGTQPGQALAALAEQDNFIQWSGAYQPMYRLASVLRPLAQNPGATSLSTLTSVTVQFYNTDRLAQSLSRLQKTAGGFISSPASLLNWTNVQVQLTAQALADVSSWPDVLNIEPYQTPRMRDEMQAQILAGNLNQVAGAMLSAGPGYLSWLKARGFPSDPAQYPLVDLFDDGLDSGNIANILHPDFYTNGDKTSAARIAFLANCTSDPTGNGVGGHGDLNAGILAGYNAASGAPYQDAQGYHLGLGISPFGRIASTKVFTNTGGFDLSRCNNSIPSMVYDAYTRGARITSNSWDSAAFGAYDTQAQTYDVLTRDASALPGNQEMLHIFAAGNEGPGNQTVGSPGTAKDVLTVGATESVRGSGIEDGCFISSASSADNLAVYSGRGPTKDGRIKPDIMAPGTHIQGPAAQDPAFNGSGVCGGFTQTNLPTPYYPAGQTLYTWSTGTSHATPAISGVAQLVYNAYQRAFNPGAAPSPAMIKALILNTPRYLTGTSANDTLPSPNQGWGDADMSQIFAGGPRMLFDQKTLLTASGQEFTTSGYITSSSRPLRVTLAWTDAPGQPVAGSDAVNNLDLEVTVQGVTYLGNVMNGQLSVSGGLADQHNNVESVFLPPGISGPFTVRVIARCLAGDGVPGNSSLTDQDFALVINNATPEPLKYHTWLEIIRR